MANTYRLSNLSDRLLWVGTSRSLYPVWAAALGRIPAARGKHFQKVPI